MDYKEKLLYFMYEVKDIEALNKWIDEQPPLEQTDIFRQLQELSLEIAGDNEEVQEINKDLASAIDQYEDSILDEKLAEANYVMALEAQEKALQENDETKKGIRKRLIECVVNNESNAEEMKLFALKIIAFEKKTGEFNADNWIGIL